MRLAFRLILSAVIVILLAGLSLKYMPRAQLPSSIYFPERTSGNWYWARRLAFYAYPMEESSTQIYYVWVKPRDPQFYKVDKAQAQAAYPAAVKEQIERLIHFMELDLEEFGKVIDDEFYLDLQVLTGQHFGEDVAAWRKWWNPAAFQVAPDAYERLRRDRIEREKGKNKRKLSETELSEASYHRQFLEAQTRFKLGIAGVVVLISVIATVIWVVVRAGRSNKRPF